MARREEETKCSVLQPSPSSPVGAALHVKMDLPAIRCGIGQARQRPFLLDKRRLKADAIGLSPSSGARTSSSPISRAYNSHPWALRCTMSESSSLTSRPFFFKCLRHFSRRTLENSCVFPAYTREALSACESQNAPSTAPMSGLSSLTSEPNRSLTPPGMAIAIPASIAGEAGLSRYPVSDCIDRRSMRVPPIPG